MDLTTIKGIAKSRWWILLAAGVLAVTVSGRLAEYRNDNIPQFEAISTVTFTEDPAAFARYGVLESEDIAEISLVSEENHLEFIGRGETQAEANELTEVMRDRYLAASQVGAGQDRLDTELVELTHQIAELRTQISIATAAIPLTEEQVQTQAQRAALETRISALESHYGSLVVELISPIARTPEEIQAEMDRVYNELLAAQIALAPIPLTAA